MLRKGSLPDSVIGPASCRCDVVVLFHLSNLSWKRKVAWIKNSNRFLLSILLILSRRVKGVSQFFIKYFHFMKSGKQYLADLCVNERPGFPILWDCCIIRIMQLQNPIFDIENSFQVVLKWVCATGSCVLMIRDYAYITPRHFRSPTIYRAIWFGFLTETPLANII